MLQGIAEVIASIGIKIENICLEISQMGFISSHNATHIRILIFFKQFVNKTILRIFTRRCYQLHILQCCVMMQLNKGLERQEYEKKMANLQNVTVDDDT